MHGVNLYAGTTGSGKTHAALEDLQRIVAENPELRRVVLDLGGSLLLSREAKAGGTGSLAGRWTPETVEEYEAVLDRIYREGNCAVLVDDVMALPSRKLSKLCRLWRPRNLRILITTQHISGDVEQAVMACDPLIFAFRTTSPRSLEWLAKWHQVDESEVKALGLGEALELAF